MRGDDKGIRSGQAGDEGKTCGLPLVSIVMVIASSTSNAMAPVLQYIARLNRVARSERPRCPTRTCLPARQRFIIQPSSLLVPGLCPAGSDDEQRSFSSPPPCVGPRSYSNTGTQASFSNTEVSILQVRVTHMIDPFLTLIKATDLDEWVT